VGWYYFFRREWRTAEVIVYSIVALVGLAVAWTFGHPPWKIIADLALDLWDDHTARPYLLIAGCLILLRIGLSVWQHYSPRPINL